MHMHGKCTSNSALKSSYLLSSLSNEDSNLSVVPTISMQLDERKQFDAKDVLAKLLGYLLAVGATTLYAPIIIALLISKDSSGLSIETWTMNVIGTMLAISYPIKKRFPFSTYVELTALLLQSVLILGLVCYFQGLSVQYLLGIIPTLLLFGAFTVRESVPVNVLKSLQIASILLCTSANIP